ncbi:hypothetical protein K492DRAFT_204006 [Lichtheimia hyalospora FSU 10163]|nr:hypothetical protein K492DRAFT_204006 [Lichtheimia hyalospora FSU 10163]
MALHEPGVTLQQQQQHHSSNTSPLLPKQQASNIAQLYHQLQQAAFDDLSVAQQHKTTSTSLASANINSNIPSSSSSLVAAISTTCSPSLPPPPIIARTDRASCNMSSCSVPSSTRSSSESSCTNSSSPITPHHQVLMTNPPVCVCEHWLVSVDSEHCGLCDDPQPALQWWQAERTVRVQTIDRTQSQLERLKDKQSEQHDYIQRLRQQIITKEQAIERRGPELEALKQDLEILQQKCTGERQQVQQIQQSKESVKRELEELSQRLFEEANEMIQHEKKEKERIEQDLDVVRHLLTEAQSDLALAEKELAQLRHHLQSEETKYQKQQHHRPSSTCTNLSDHRISTSSSSALVDTHVADAPPLSSLMRAQIDVATQSILSNSNQATSQPNKPSLGVQVEASEDDHCLMEFRQFIDTATTVSLRKLNSLPFMKHVIEEDVKPTLRFGPNPRMACRKIIDAILVKTCFVEDCPPGYVNQLIETQQRQQAAAAANSENTIASLWERFSLSPVFYGCQACGRAVAPEEKDQCDQVLLYRFRTSYFDEWSCIDRYCRDRLESVIQFYAFLRQLRIGAYRHRSLTDLYQECSRLRLQMFLARMGALPGALHGCGMDPDRLAKASPEGETSRLSSSTAVTV